MHANDNSPRLSTSLDRAMIGQTMTIRQPHRTETDEFDIELDEIEIKTPYHAVRSARELADEE